MSPSRNVAQTVSTLMKLDLGGTTADLDARQKSQLSDALTTRVELVLGILFHDPLDDRGGLSNATQNRKSRAFNEWVKAWLFLHRIRHSQLSDDEQSKYAQPLPKPSSAATSIDLQKEILQLRQQVDVQKSEVANANRIATEEKQKYDRLAQEMEEHRQRRGEDLSE